MDSFVEAIRGHHACLTGQAGLSDMVSDFTNSLSGLSNSLEEIDENVGWLRGGRLSKAQRLEDHGYHTPIQPQDEQALAISTFDSMGEPSTSFENTRRFLATLVSKPPKDTARERDTRGEAAATAEEPVRLKPVDRGVTATEESAPAHSPDETASAEAAPCVEEEPVLFVASGGTWLDKCLVASESSRDAVADALKRVPEQVFARCFAAGGKLYVLDKGKSTWPGLSRLPKEQLNLSGGYAPDLRVAYMRREAMEASGMEDLPLMLLGHMYDHALGGDTFSSLRSPAVYGLYRGAKQGNSGHHFMSGFGEQGFTPYFADGFAAYFSQSSRGKMLGTVDPAMHEYMRCLFGSA